MLRKITQESRNVVRDRIISSSASSQSSYNVSLKAFSTWLAVQHSTFSLEKRPEVCHSPTKLSNLDQRFASTRHSYRVKQPESDLLPRYLRRANLQRRGKQEISAFTLRYNNKEGSKAIPSSKERSAYRSRHYNPENPTRNKSEIRLLEPHVLSERLKKLCDAGKNDDAVYMLKNAPLDAQNTEVWNTLIWECMKAKRFKLGYQLYIDMKRRGFSPTTRTFKTLFVGLSKIEQWPLYLKQLEHAHSLYQHFQRHIESLKKHDPTHEDLNIIPIGAYIRILGKAGYYQRTFDVFYALDQEGRLAPNKHIYTAMFEAIVFAKRDTVEERLKAAADARLLWNHMIRSSKQRADCTPDSYAVTSVIKALTGGSPTDHELAFNIVTQYFGLFSGKPVSGSGSLSLSPESLQVILQLCNLTERHAICREYIQQVKRRPEATGGVAILDRGHMEEGLKAEIAIREPGLGYHAVETLEWMLRQEFTGENGPRIRPSLSTYNLVMQSCWRSADWRSGLRTFELLTGYHAHDFMDGSTKKEPRLDQRGRGRNLPLTAQFLSLMVQTAILSKSPANMRQALRIVDIAGFDNLLITEENGKSIPSKLASQKEHYIHKFAFAVSSAANSVLKTGEEKEGKVEETRKWKALAEKAEKVFDDARAGKIAHPKVAMPKVISPYARNPPRRVSSEPSTC